MGLRQDFWEPPSDHRILKKGEIYVWRVCLNQDSLTVRALYETLSADEKQKAHKYHFVKDRDHFVVARGTLRKILGRYLNIAPHGIRFSYTRYGKPYVDMEDNLLRFNASRSQGVALCAFTRGQEVGVDIEFINDNFEILKTAQSFFSPTEISMLKNLPSDLQTRAFFCGWTRKEAYLKALGEGFSYPSNQFTVSVMEEESNIAVRTAQFKNARDWSLISLPSEQNYSAALAVKGKVGTIRYWQSNEGICR